MASSSLSTLVHPGVLPVLEFACVHEVNDREVLVTAEWLGPDPRPAQRLYGIAELEPGDRVVVALVGEDRGVVILGPVHSPREAARDVRVNGRRVTIEADAQIVLQCATATITIGRDGLVAVRGDHVTSHARGRHRIRGGSVEIN